MLDVDALVAGIRAGARRPLARAITLAESTREDHRTAAREVLARLGKPRDTLRIAVSGVPGAGTRECVEVRREEGARVRAKSARGGAKVPGVLAGV